MKFLTDFLPILCFFIAFKFGNAYSESSNAVLNDLGVKSSLSTAPILLATLVGIVVTTLQVLWQYLQRRKVDRKLLIGLALIVIFGGATLIFHDDKFIKWKPTVLYWIFAGALILGNLFKHNFLQRLLGNEVTLAPPLWRTISMQWIVFFLAMGALNLLVAFHYSTATWVNFKLFGSMGLLFLFAILQAVFIARSERKS